MPHLVRQLAAADAAAFRAVRLHGLLAHPRAFGADHDEEAGQPPAFWESRLTRNPTFGGFDPDGSLHGIATLSLPAGRRYRHRAELAGLYVMPAARGSGLALALIEAVAAEARTRGVEDLVLGVGLFNAPAIALYQRAGFRPFAVEADALRVNGEPVDEILMRRQP